MKYGFFYGMFILLLT